MEVQQETKKDLQSRSYRLALDVIHLFEKLDNSNFVIQIIARQLIRSATSIGANIVEAQAASSKKDFTNFYSYALKSANESKFWFSILSESGKADRIIVAPLQQETSELANMLGASILTLKGKGQSEKIKTIEV